MGHELLDAAQSALFEVLVISLPILGAGLLVGLVISLVQAVTQVQEQSLTFLPRIVVMIVAAIALLGWITARMLAFATEMFTGVP